MHEPELSPDVEEAIRKTMLGNPDGIRYRHLEAIKKIGEIEKLHFFPLRKNGELIYVMALAERITKFKGSYFYTYYVRYVTFNPVFAAKTLISDKNITKMQRVGNSFFKKGMINHANSFPFELKSEKADPQKRIYYAHVEETNLRSLNFTEFFFEKIRNFNIITYSNVFPKDNVQVSKLKKNDLKKMLCKLGKYYSNHSLFYTDEQDLLENYFVLKRDGEIIAGVMAKIANWKIEQIPGFFGKIVKHVLPYMPVLKRITTKESFRFLSFDTIYCKEGEDQVLTELFGSVCAQLKVYAAMIYLDSREPLVDRINKLDKMGLLNKLYTNVQGVILARFINFTDAEKKEFKENPVYISGYDLT